MATTVKKCLKLHKLFVNELARSTRLESEGSQVLSSLSNVSQRVPTLLQSSSARSDANSDAEGNVEVMGVLSYSCNTQELLLQKHFLAMEKSRGFLADILRDYQELLRHIRSFTVDGTVLAMLEHEVLRKTRLVADLEYNDTGRLSRVAKQWSSQGAMGNVDNDFVQTGLQLPQAKASPSVEDASHSKSKKKKKSKAKK
ncbi:hypothetical protein PInf_010941 [Phytophthora infestans]|nr:hypothetical protein PInf_010941 [Phytophthora infestans]